MAKPVATPTFREWLNGSRECTETPIVVGTGVTESCGSDAYPYEVVEIRTSRKILIRSMNSVPTPGSKYLDDSWVITSNPEGRIETLRRGTDGLWKSAGGTRYYPGHASRHHDPHF